MTRTGEKRVITWNTIILRDAKNKFIGVISSGEDVTKRKRAEDELVASELRVRTLLQSIQDMVFVIDETNHFSDYYVQKEDDLYTPPSRFIGKGIPDALPEPLASELVKIVEDVRRTGESVTHDYDLVIAGGRKWFSAILSLHADGKSVVAVVRDITDQKKALEELEEAYKIITVSSVVAFLWKNDDKWSVEFVTENVHDLFGYSADEWISGTIRYASVIHPDDLPRVISEVSGFSEDALCESFIHEPYRIITKNNEIRWVSDSTVIRRDTRGNITHYQGVVTDITDERHALQKVQRERTVFKSIAKAAIHSEDATEMANLILNGFIGAMGLEIGTLRLYDRKKSVLRPTASVGIMNDLKDKDAPLKGPDSESYFVSYAAKVRKRIIVPNIDEHPEYHSFKNLAKMNLKSFIVIPLFNAKKELVGTFAAGSTEPYKVSFDDYEFYEAIEELLVTLLEREQTKQAYRMSLRRYRELLTNLSEGITIVDLDKKYVFVNKAFCNIIGYSEEELVGTDSRVNVHPDDLELISQETEARKMGMPSTYRLRLITKKGDVRITRVSAIPSRDDFGEIEGTVALVSDITDRVRAEEEVKTLNIELAKRVEDRTAELQAAVSELEAFAYTVSHDLRAPLRVIDGFSQAILEDYSETLDDVGRDFLRRIRVGVTNMSRLIEDILGFSRVTRIDMDRVDVNLSRLAGEVVSELRELDPQRTVNVDIQPDIIARCDKRLIRIVLHNLFENAWKFTSQTDDPQIRFGMKEQDETRTFYIQDNGIGFDKRDTERLFKPFHRLHRSDEFEGSGIGLATVTRIISKHGGEIWAEGKVGKGATFFFTLS